MMELRREILFNVLPDTQLYFDTQNKTCFKIESIMLPVGFFRNADKITLTFPNISDESKEIIVVNDERDKIQRFHHCSVAIDEHLFTEYGYHHIYDGTKTDRRFNCNGKGMNRDDIHINKFDINSKEVPFCVPESNIKITLCFYF